MNILVYTFRTFPYTEDLSDIFPNIVIIRKLKEDLEIFYDLIIKQNPDLILGVALSNSTNSIFEPIAINQFHKKSKVIKDGKPKLSLFVPEVEGTDFNISSKPTDSFCNYSMYKVQSFLEKNKINTSFSFCHIKKKQIAHLPLILKNI